MAFMSEEEYGQWIPLLRTAQCNLTVPSTFPDRPTLSVPPGSRDVNCRIWRETSDKTNEGEVADQAKNNGTHPDKRLRWLLNNSDEIMRHSAQHFAVTAHSAIRLLINLPVRTSFKGVCRGPMQTNNYSFMV